MPRANTTVTRRRLNLRGLLVLGVTVLVGIVGFWGLKAYHERHVSSLKQEARERWKQKQYSIALGLLNRYLELHPDELDALDLKAQFLAESAHDEAQALEAINIHKKVLGRDPKRQDVRRRLVELNLMVRGMGKTAVTYARGLIDGGDDSASAHRLLARALEKSAAEGDESAIAAACDEFEIAEKREPGDVAGAELLARLYQDKLNNTEKALEVLDRLLAQDLKTPAKRVEARLARARFFARLNRQERAEAEVEKALPEAPNNREVRLMAAQLAAQKGDTASARQHLAAIPEAERDDLQIKLVQGQIDLRERRPDDAIQSWRSGLLLTGGNNIDLTWRLAQVQLEMGRVSEAEPLMAQYRRLVGGDEPDPWYRYLHALSLYKTNRSPEAITELEAIQFKIDKVLEPSLYLLLGQSYEETRNRDKAVIAFRKAAELAPAQADAWLATARLQWTEKHPDEALDTLALGLKAAPREPRLLAAQAQYLFQQQMRRPPAERSWDELEKAFARDETLAPGSIDVALVRTDYLLTLGKADETLALLEAVTKRAPKLAYLWEIRARALKLYRSPAEALKVLDEAIDAVGPRALFFTARASILLAQGHAQEAHATLKAALDRVPNDQKAALWKALGDLALGQNDLPAAREAFQQCVRLEPSNPEPRLTLLDLALTVDDKPAIRAGVEGLKALGGGNSIHWRLARVQELLQVTPKTKGDFPLLEEAAGLIREIQKDDPQSTRGYLLEGRLHERREETDAAIQAFEKAVDLNGGTLPLAALVALLVREKRDADLDRLRKKLTVLPAEIDRLATLEALKVGDKDRAERLAARMAEEHPEALDAQVWQALVLKDLGKPEAAEAALRRLIQQRPTESAPRLQLLTLQIAQKRLKDAAETVEQIRKEVKSDRPELLWAQCYRAMGDLPRAEEFIRDALKKWPDDLAVRTAAVDYCELTGRQGEAEAMLRKVLERDPALGWATRKLALLRASHRNDRAAWDEALRLIGPEARPDETPDDLLTRAHVYAQGPEPSHRKKAREILEQLAVALPKSPAVHELLARLAFASGDLVQARKYAAIAASAGTNLDNQVLLARVLIASKAFDDAETQLKALESAAPDSFPVVELRARLLTAQGKAKEGADALVRSMEGRLNTIRDLPNGERMIRLLLDLNQPEGAEQVARMVGKLGTRGKCLLAEFLAARTKTTKEAAALLQAAAAAGDPRNAAESALALATRPSADPVWLGLADTFLTQARADAPNALELIERQALLRHFQQRPKEQVALYEELLKRNPPSYHFLNDMAWALSEDLEDPKEGLRRADEGREKMGREPHLLDTRGVILTRLGRYDEAITDLEAAADALPTGPICFHLARAYLKKGRTDDSKKALERARQAGLVPDQLPPAERDQLTKEMSH